jgi:hypothetical protein
MSKSEKWAAWVTAIATSAQTIAVIITVVVAWNEWRAHERQSAEAKKIEAIRLYDSGGPAVDQSRTMVTQFLKCRDLRKKDVTTLNTDDSLFLRDHCSIWSGDWAALSTILKPLGDFVDRAATCVGAQLCDRELTSHLFCTDAKLIHRLLVAFDSDSHAALGRSSFPGYVDFICTQQDAMIGP